MSQDIKFDKLKEILAKMDSVLLAYSGGVDSTFLLKVAKGVLGNKLLAVTADSQTYTKEELVFARSMAKRFKVEHIVIKTNELSNKKFLKNPKNRCYFCKKELFTKLKEIAKKNNIKFVVDATNYSDRGDYRPGRLAKKELGVRSPLDEARISKEDIRKLSKHLKLPTWNKPALACLASRFPYGAEITLRALRRIERAEGFIRSLGISQVRLRHYNGLARIEVLKKEIPTLIKKRSLIVEKLKKLGYNYVTIDLEGYRTGSLNIGVR